ncbi:MAG: hypothetical protein ACKVLA_14690 [Rhodobacterales bacterium]
MATAPKISNLPAAPNRQQPASFTPKSDALLSALPGFVSETNAVADYVEGAAGQVAIDKAAVDANVPLLSDAKAAAPLALQYRDTAKGYKDSAAASEAQTLQHLQDAQSALVYQDLASIAATKNITMTAGCIDTSPNPPLSVQMAGSLWREPLNTATRGSRRELPAKKVWIIEARKIALYDGDDPALPLWRDFTKGRPAFSATKFNSVTAANGVMVSAEYTGYKGYLKIDFNSDRWEFEGSGGGGNGSGVWRGPIYNPLLTSDVTNDNTRGTLYTEGYRILSRDVYCLDSRVYPWSEMHPVSGVQIPTIAFGTNLGISILNGPAGAGTITNITHSANTHITDISLNEDGSLFYVTDSGTTGRYVHGRTSLPLVSEARGTGSNVSGSEFFFHSVASANYGGQSGKLMGGNANLITDGVIANNGGLTFLIPNQVSPDETLRAFVDTDHNTGLMAKGCEGVWFCDTETGSLSDGSIVLDRSGKGNALPVSGILTRTPMGNSDAVGYAGAGFVEIPTELTQVGLDDFCLTGIVEITGNITQHIFGQSIKDTTVTNWTFSNVLYFGLEYTGGGNHALALGISKSDGSGNRIAFHSLATGSVFKVGQVLAFAAVRRDGVCSIMVNGTVVATATPSTAVDVHPVKTAYIREALAVTPTVHQSMRDIKWHKGHAPSDEELREIARVDIAKQNGPTTMRGVVKNVYTLTKDKVTGLVHVGNNGGRSTFAFPLLVDESSDAATNAIVAHDGMILEN